MEILKGKCLEAFRDYWCTTEELHSSMYSQDFDKLPFSKRYDVYEDFFKSVGITINIEKDFIHTGSEVYYWNVFPILDDFGCFEVTLNEAKKSSIKKAVETYNKRK